MNTNRRESNRYCFIVSLPCRALSCFAFSLRNSPIVFVFELVLHVFSAHRFLGSLPRRRRSRRARLPPPDS
jgi:hypothetical protein